MQVLEYREFGRSLAKLRRKGGRYERAANEVLHLRESLHKGEDIRNKQTNYGENRVKHAVKYDLENSCRLVTVQNAGVVFLCFAGTHDDADRWLDEKRGWTVRVDECSRPILTFESFNITEPTQRIERSPGYTSKPLLSQLEMRLQDGLLAGIPNSLAKRIDTVEAHITDDEIERLIADIDKYEQKAAVFDVLLSLRADNLDEATNRVRAYLGELRELAIVAKKPLINSADFQHISVDSEQYRQLIEHFARTAEFRDWMLFMHPDQQQYVDADYAGPTKLSGVSGSGKTCVVVRRALALAQKYPEGRVLVLTLNRSLAALMERLVEKAALPTTPNKIDVLPFFKLCQSLLKTFEPENERLYDDVTWKSKEHIDEVWREFYRCELNNHGARILQRLHDSLIARGIDAESYVREEFDWIRSATTPDGRDRYLDIERSGRTYKLDEAFRRELLQGLLHWEEKMRFVGVTDYLGIASALYRHIHKLTPAYRCILIDESQDFGSLDIRLIRRMAEEAENDIFLCGDAAQQVSSKHQNLSDAGVAVPGARSHRLDLNYRNSRLILEVAHGMLLDHFTEQMVDSKDFEVLDPKYANFSGPTPALLSAGSLREELFAALSYARGEANANSMAKICVAVCGFSEHELELFGAVVGLPILNGEANLEEGQVFLSDLENTKGFEFQCMVVVNCAVGVIPYPRSPEEETFRDLSRLYVAMTRARHQLVISHSGEPSKFVASQKERFAIDSWQSYLGTFAVPEEFEPPAKLEQLRSDGKKSDVLSMTGEEYLYTEHALNCSSILIEKLRALVRGHSKTTSAGVAIEWRTLRDAVRDTRNQVRSRQVFGPEGYRLFRERFDAMLGNQPREIRLR